jgi:hypothetical protein
MATGFTDGIASDTGFAKDVEYQGIAFPMTKRCLGPRRLWLVAQFF